MPSDLELKFIELLRKPVKSKEEVQELERTGKDLELEYRKETFDLIAELKEAGLEINDIWELVNTKEPYPEAIDILLKHLPKQYHDKNKEGIIRALAVKEAKGKATSALINEFNNTPKEKQNLRWIIGNTIYTTIADEDIASILSIVKDKENGMSRQMFVAALGKIKFPQVELTLIELLNDDQVAANALEALGRLKSMKAKGQIMQLLYHPNSLIKKEARKALKKIEQHKIP